MAKRKTKSKQNWFERIATARENGSFTDVDKYEASSWPDCACGEQSKFIPRDYDDSDFGDGEPKDRKLVRLGASFANAVEGNKFKRAEDLLVKIQTRSSEILNGLLSEYESKAKAIRKELQGAK